jgi:hypothetical protein
MCGLQVRGAPRLQSSQTDRHGRLFLAKFHAGESSAAADGSLTGRTAIPSAEPTGTSCRKLVPWI